MIHTEDKLHFYRESSFSFRDLRGIHPIRPYLDNSCFFKSKTNFTYEQHTHQNYELIVGESQPYTCLLNGRQVTMPAGHLLLVQPGDTHQGILKCEQKLFVVTFGIDTDSMPKDKLKIFNQDSPLESRILALSEIESVKEIYKVFYQMSKVDSARSYYVLNGLFQSFFWSLVSLWPQEILHPMVLQETYQENFKDRLMAIFMKNVYGHLCVEEIAAEMQLKPRSFERKCRDLIQMSPKAAFLNFKLRQLERQVVNSKLSIKEISEMYGYENQFNFSRIFKKHFGLSPLAYRFQHQNEAPKRR